MKNNAGCPGEFDVKGAVNGFVLYVCFKYCMCYTYTPKVTNIHLDFKFHWVSCMFFLNLTALPANKQCFVFQKDGWIPPCLLAADPEGWLRFPACSPVASTPLSQYWAAFPSSLLNCQLFLMSYTPQNGKLKKISFWGETLRETEMKRAPLQKDGGKNPKTTRSIVHLTPFQTIVCR